MKNCSPVGRTHTGEFHGGLSPLGRIPCWRKGKKEKVAAEKKIHDELTVFPAPCTTEGGEKTKDEAKLRKEEDTEGR